MILDSKMLTLLIKQPMRSEFPLDKCVNELCRGGFFFFLQVLNVLRILGGGRIFLNDTCDQVILFLGGRGVVNAIRELLNSLTSAHVLH
jgi:hypothetical protein